MAKKDYISKEEFILKVKHSKNFTDLCVKLEWSYNGTSFNSIKELIKKWNVDTSHFDQQYKNRKYQQIEKECPVCYTKFITKKGHKKEKIVCSIGCANTFFRSGKNHPNYIDGRASIKKFDKILREDYRVICFSKYPYKCLLCDWNISVDVHHLDEDRNNNNIDNLIPLCPNHHRVIHIKKYKHKIKKQISETIRQNVYVAERNTQQT